MELTNQNKNRKQRKPTDLSTQIYGKVPPQARELEEAIIGAVMLDSNCLPEVISMINADMFYVNSHQVIFGSIVRLYDKNKKVDILTVVEELKNTEELEVVGGAYAVTKMTNSVVSTANIVDHCKIVIEKYMGREMIRISGEAISDAYDDSTDIFELFDATDNAIFTTQEKVLKGAVKDMAHYSAKVYEQYESVKATGVLGIQTGILPIDKILFGLVAPDLIIIAARPGQGKTALALSITHHTSMVMDVPCAWFSLEMDGVQLARRLASIDSGISHELIRQGKVNMDSEKKFYNSLDKISKSPIYIEDKVNINIRTIRTRANILKRKNKIQYIVVDYLQLMSGITKGGSREQEVSEISRGLKTLAKELEIPVIALSQLSREVEKRPDKMPQLSDLRESGAIEQDADDVVFLMRPEYYHFQESVMIKGKEYDPQGLCIGSTAKNRHGACQNFAMAFLPNTMHFSTHRNDYDFHVPQETSNDIDPF